MVHQKNTVIELQANLEQYYNEHPDAAYDDLIDEFGVHDAYIESYISFNSVSEIRTEIKNAHHKKHILILGSVSIILAIILATAINIKLKNSLATNGYVTIEEEKNSCHINHICYSMVLIL